MRTALALVGFGLVFASARPVSYAQPQTPAAVNLAACAACAGDGETDDTAAVQAFLNGNAGSIVQMPGGKRYLIDSANLTIPTATAVVGARNVMVMMQGANDPTPPSGFILNPAYTILTSTGSSLENLAIQRKGLIASPSAPEYRKMLDTWGADWSNGLISTGVTVQANYGGVRLRRLYIEGFYWAIMSEVGQFIFSDIVGDDYNGIYARSAADVNFIEDARFEPFYCIHSSRCKAAGAAWDHAGTGFYFRRNNSNFTASRLFAFMYHQGIILDGIAASVFSDVSSEWDANPTYGGFGTSALRVINPTSGVSVRNAFSNGQAIDFDLESPSGIDLSNPRVSPVSLAGSYGVAPFYLGTNSATPFTLMPGGTPAAGQTVTVVVADRAMPASPQTISYMVRPGDTLYAIAGNLAVMLNTNAYLAGLHMVANVIGPVNQPTVTLYWPANAPVTPTVTSASSGLAITHPGGTAQGGSIGMIENIALGDPSHPTILAGGATGTWKISGVSGLLYPGWASFPSANGLVQFFGVYDMAYGVNVSGTGCTNGGGNFSTNSGGTIAETTASTGCTIRFNPPWPWAPNCIVQGYGATQPRSVTEPTATSFSWTNPAPAAAQKFTYKCDFH